MFFVKRDYAQQISLIKIQNMKWLQRDSNPQPISS